MVTQSTTKINTRTLVNPNNTPRQLWPYRQFTCWRYVDRGPDRKPDKVPVNCVTLGNAGSTWPNTWTDIRTAVTTYRDHDDLAGISFVLTQHDPYAMIDLDDCLLGDCLSPFVAEILDRLNTYTEYSPSGRGLRLFVHCEQQPDALKRPEIEIYSTGRFATLTGNVLHQRPIAKIDSLIWLTERFAPKEQQQQTHASLCSHPAPSADDDGLWERIRHFNRLADQLYQGNLAPVGGNHSQGVLMLLNCLARWTRCDAGRMENMIRMTAIDKSKWDTKRGQRTWLQMQIADAINHEGG